MRLFDRVFLLRVPEDPMEGMLKLLLFSQFITVPMTMLMDFSTEESLDTSLLITKIHLAAMFIGYLWGTMNQEQNVNQPIRAFGN